LVLAQLLGTAAHPAGVGRGAEPLEDDVGGALQPLELELRIDAAQTPLAQQAAVFVGVSRLSNSFATRAKRSSVSAAPAAARQRAASASARACS
jgi:hypothetical protein